MNDIFLDFNNKKNARFVHAFSQKELEKIAQKNGLQIERSLEIKRKNGQGNFVLICKKI